MKKINKLILFLLVLGNNLVAMKAPHEKSLHIKISNQSKKDIFIFLPELGNFHHFTLHNLGPKEEWNGSINKERYFFIDVPKKPMHPLGTFEKINDHLEQVINENTMIIIKANGGIEFKKQ